MNRRFTYNPANWQRVASSPRIPSRSNCHHPVADPGGSVVKSTQDDYQGASLPYRGGAAPWGTVLRHQQRYPSQEAAGIDGAALAPSRRRKRAGCFNGSTICIPVLFPVLGPVTFVTAGNRQNASCSTARCRKGLTQTYPQYSPQRRAR